MATHFPINPVRRSADTCAAPGAAKGLPLFEVNREPRNDSATSGMQWRYEQNANHPRAAGLLSSWKDISNYLSRGVRTVQRWEVTQGLPVHRMGIGHRAPVFAFQNEIDEWLQKKAGAEVTQSSRPINIPRGHSNSRRQQLIKVVEELRHTATGLEKAMAQNAIEPDANISHALLAIQKLVKAALAPNQLVLIKKAALKGELPDEIQREVSRPAHRVPIQKRISPPAIARVPY